MGARRVGFRRPIVMVGLATVMVAAAAGAAFVILGGEDDGGGVTRPEETAWQHVMDELPETGETTVEMARQAFSLTFEQLPGVHTPAGTRGDIQSGSAALRMMIAHWAELSDADRGTVLSYLPTADGDSTPTGDTIVKLIGYSSRRSEAGGPDDATKALIERRVAALRTSLGARAGAFLVGEVELSYNTRDIVVGSAAYALPHTAGQVLTNPTPDTVIQPGRVLIAIGTPTQLATLAGVIHDGSAEVGDPV